MWILPIRKCAESVPKICVSAFFLQKARAETRNGCAGQKYTFTQKTNRKLKLKRTHSWFLHWQKLVDLRVRRSMWRHVCAFSTPRSLLIFSNKARIKDETNQHTTTPRDRWDVKLTNINDGRTNWTLKIPQNVRFSRKNHQMYQGDRGFDWILSR